MTTRRLLVKRARRDSRAVRIGITGGTGFVGGHLAIDRARHGHDVVVVARGMDNRPLAEAVRNEPGVTVVRAGLDDVDALAEAFEGAHGVAHCAGINREIGRQTYRGSARARNIQRGSRCRACRRKAASYEKFPSCPARFGVAVPRFEMGR